MNDSIEIISLLVDLLRMIEHNTSIVFPAAPLLTVILALIGKNLFRSIVSSTFFARNGSDYVGILQRCIHGYDSRTIHSMEFFFFSF